MQQDKKRKLVDRIRNVLKSFLEYMKLEVDEDDDEYYEADEDYKVEFTKKEWIQSLFYWETNGKRAVVSGRRSLSLQESERRKFLCHIWELVFLILRIF